MTRSCYVSVIQPFCFIYAVHPFASNRIYLDVKQSFV